MCKKLFLIKSTYRTHMNSLNGWLTQIPKTIGHEISEVLRNWLTTGNIMKCCSSYYLN